MHYLAVCCFFKNETRYLPEWIEAHLLCGVEHFFLLCNDDDPEPTQQLLIRYDKSVTAHYSGGGNPAVMQTRYYTTSLPLFAKKSRWVAFIDGDEFLLTHGKGDVRTALQDYEKFGGLGINWKCYGSSGLFFPPRSQIESFVYRADDNSANSMTFKSIINPSKAAFAVNPHSFQFRDGEVTVDEHGNELPVGTAMNYKSVSGPRLRINHYRTRSWSDYLIKHKKWRRGGHPDFVTNGNDQGGFLHYWRMNDQNDVYDDAAHWMLPELEEVVRRAGPPERPAPSPLCPGRTTTPLDYA